MSENETLTYEDLQENWRKVEEEVVHQQFSEHEAEHSYQHVRDRVINWLLNEANILDTLPKDLANFMVSRHDALKSDLLTNRIIPSSPILKYGGTRHPKKNYFSSTALEDITSYNYDFIEEAYTLGTICGARFPQAAVGVDVESIYTDLGEDVPSLRQRKGSFAVTLSEDSIDLDRFIHSEHHFGISPYVGLTNKCNDTIVSPIAIEVHSGNNIGLIFGRNLKEMSPFPTSLEPFFLSAFPGYIGMANSSCPTFYANLPEIISTSKDYNDFLRRLHKVAFNATLLANIVLFQEEGYLSEEIKNVSLKYRPVIVSMLGLHGAMMRCDVNYESEEALQFAEQSQASILLGSMAASSRLMVLSSKRDRVACRSSWLVEGANKCSESLNGCFATKAIINHISSAMEKHGCLFNGLTTGQVPDPYVNAMAHSLSYGISPITSIETTVQVGGEDIVLFPVEIFDRAGNMTCDLQILQEHTSSFISPDYQLQIVKKIQQFSHAGVFKPILCPTDITVQDLVRLFHQAEEAGLKTVTFSREDFSLQEREVILEDEPKDNLEDEPDDEVIIATTIKELESHVSEIPDDNIGEIPMGEEVRNAKIYTLQTPTGICKIILGDDATDMFVDIPGAPGPTKNLIITLVRLISFLLQDLNDHVRQSVADILVCEDFQSEERYRFGDKEFCSLPQSIGHILLKHLEGEHD